MRFLQSIILLSVSLSLVGQTSTWSDRQRRERVREERSSERRRDFERSMEASRRSREASRQASDRRMEEISRDVARIRTRTREISARVQRLTDPTPSPAVQYQIATMKAAAEDKVREAESHLRNMKADSDCRKYLGLAAAATAGGLVYLYLNEDE